MTAGGWVHRRWRAMGCTAELVVRAPEPDAVADAVVALVGACERSWSRFDPGSDLCRLNRAAGRWVVVPERLWLALDAASGAWALTGGRFDPTVLGRLVELGYDRTFPRVPAAGPAVEGAGAVPGWGGVGLDPARRAVRLPAGTGIDLGGIGKGLAVDLAAELLTGRATAGCLSLGGDLAVRGPGPGVDGEWPVPVHVAGGVELGTFPLVDEALVQSTTAIRRWSRGGRALHHILDPRTGRPAATDVATAVVTGPAAAPAEAVAKAAVVAGADAGLALLGSAGLDGWLLAEDGRRWTTAPVAGDLVGSHAG